MPLPKPNSGEKENDFISRCISSIADTDPNTPENQRIAICYSQWRGKESFKEPWEETDQYIRSGHREPGDTCRTITISDDQGIKAIYCRYGDSWAIQSYLFSKEKNWTMSKAKTWFASHQNESLEEMHLDFRTVLANYQKFYGDDEGKTKFYDWLTKYDLDPEKPYSNQAQLYECFGGLCEAFRWVDPLIKFYKEDNEATYWKVKALTASISMNKRDYTNVNQLQQAAPTLTWRPLNWNHDPNKFLPFPDARTDMAAYEDKSAETIIRIPNDLKHYKKDKLVNQMFRDNDIIHVSIEGEPRGRKGNAPENYNFTALALLEKDVTLPGDPLTSIEPLFINESMGRSLVESLSKSERDLEDGLIPMTEKLEEYAKASLETPWDYDESKYDIDQLRYASAVATGPSGTGDTYVKNDFHLPHHLPGDGKTHGGTVVWRGVSAAGAAIQGGRGGVKLSAPDIAKAKTHLKTHYSEFDKVPPWEAENVTEALRMAIKELYGMDVCGQCKSFEDLDNATIRIEHATGGDSAIVSRTEGGIGPGVGICNVAHTLIRKQDAACTDGRPRDSPTGLDRTMEDVKSLAEKATLLKDLAFEKQLTQEAQQREAVERQEKIKSMRENATLSEQISKHRVEIAELTGSVTQFKEERNSQIKTIDNLKESNARLQVAKDSAEQNVKLFKEDIDRLDKEKSRLVTENQQFREDLTKANTKANDESAKRAESADRVRSADTERSRVQSENAILAQQLSEKTAEISDYARRVSDSANRELKLQRELQEVKESTNKYIDEIRDLKQRLSRSPSQINITI